MAAVSPSQNQNSCEHLLKGTAWGGLSAISMVAITGIAAGVLTLGATLLIWDISFIYSWTVINPLHLLWAIPVTLTFIALDIGIILCIGSQALKAIYGLANFAKESFENTSVHFSALCLTPANSTG